MRSANMLVLTRQIQEKRPGVIIYGIGDNAHKLEVSGHNEDDTPGVRAEDQDADTKPEHRAIDVMIGPNFSAADAKALYTDLTTIEANRKRLLYVIYNRKIASASRGWVERVYDGDNPHTDHDHISGEADDDENTTPWVLSDWGAAPGVPPLPPGLPLQLEVDGELGPKTIKRWQQVMGTPADGVITPGNSMLVAAVQRRLNEFGYRLVVDGDGIYQNGKRSKTIGALQRYLKVPVDEYLSVPVSNTVKALQRRLNENKF